MTAIGIDFGTTNSIISYYEDGEAKLFVPQSSSGSPQIRSAVSVEDATGKLSIGKSAFFKRRLSGVSLFDRFKLAIGKTDENSLAAQQFLHTLIDIFKLEHRVNSIESIVITVPDQWMRNDGQISYRALLEICSKLGLAVRKILSEPVAAASYFAKCQQEMKRPFSGHALIFDYGGGTLDLSLLKIVGTDITTVDGNGVSSDYDEGGIGGCHFDRAVYDYLQEIGESTIPSSKEKVSAWLDEFEQQKIELSSDIEEKIAAYQDSNCDDVFDVETINVNGLSVPVSALVTVFKNRFAPEIKRLLKKIITRNASIIGFKKQENIKIIMVGGFSNFCMVQTLLSQQFCRDIGDPRFDIGFRAEDTSYAIAKGACLYSAEQTTVFETCPVDLAIWLRTGDQHFAAPLLVRGTPVTDISKPVFSDIIVEVDNQKNLKTSPVYLSLEPKNKKSVVEMNFSIAEAVPSLSAAHEWRVGAYVDDQMVAHLIFETNDSFKASRVMPLGAIVELSKRIVKQK